MEEEKSSLMGYIRPSVDESWTGPMDVCESLSRAATRSNGIRKIEAKEE